MNYEAQYKKWFDEHLARRIAWMNKEGLSKEQIMQGVAEENDCIVICLEPTK